MGWNQHSAALEGWDRDRSDVGFVMSGHEVESLFYGLRWMAFEILGWFLIDFFYDIPHSFLEYGTRVNGRREIWLNHSTIGWNMEVILGLDFASLMKGYFSLYLYEHNDGLYVVYMAVISLVFLSLLRCLFTCFMTLAMSGSHNALTCY